MQIFMCDVSCFVSVYVYMVCKFACVMCLVLFQCMFTWYANLRVCDVSCFVSVYVYMICKFACVMCPAAIKSDDEDDEGLAEGMPTQGEGGEVLPELSDDENEEAARRDGGE